MSPTLHLLPDRTGAAAENMALDFLLLQRYPDETALRFRHYDWRRPAFTFGYSQKIGFIRAHLPSGENFDLCRRPTGGGLVDHRQDWTFSLVIPRGHALYDARATESYRAVHECLAAALVALGQPAELQRSPAPIEPVEESRGDPGRRKSSAAAFAEAVPAGICFERAEVHDVVNPATGAKIAGAAQKRNKRGLLLQGSIEKGAVRALDWDDFAARFTAALARCCRADDVRTPWPELDETEVEGLIEQYSAPEWNELR